MPVAAVSFPSGSGCPMSDVEFSLLKGLIYREAGIHFGENKKALLDRRLRGRLRSLKLRSFAAYYRRIAKDGDQEECVRMLNCVTTQETQFFRGFDVDVISCR